MEGHRKRPDQWLTLRNATKFVIANDKASLERAFRYVRHFFIVTPRLFLRMPREALGILDILDLVELAELRQESAVIYS